MTQSTRTQSANRDPLLASLAALPRHDADDALAARVLRTSRRAFEREHARGRPPWLSPLVHAWSRFVVPAMLASTAVIYLSWAFTVTLSP